MAKSVKQLLVKIEQAGKTSQRRLMKRDRLTIGQHPDNDVTIYGEHFPKRHTLFLRKNHHYQIQLNKDMRGEVLSGNSRLSFNDMLAHDLLASKRNCFTYPLAQGRRGIVVVGDAKISFQFVEGAAQVAHNVAKFSGYSWIYATFKELGRDLAFKGILLFFVLFHIALLSYMNGLPTEISSRRNLMGVPERLARIIVRDRPVTFEEQGSTVANRPEESGETEPDLEKAKSGEAAPPERQGILGLLTGVGGTGQSSPLADFLLDKGLVEELDEVMSSTDLQIGKGALDGKATSELDNLIASSQAVDGLEDILGDVEQVESVRFGEKGQISVDKIGGMRGSQSALGKRSEESVRRVMLNYTGRLTYIYNKYLKHDADLRGKMVVEVVIAANGSVSNVKLVSSGLHNPEFEREILNFVRKWKYAAIDQGAVTVTYPLVFNKIS